MIAYIASTPVTWASKHQGVIATSTYTVELCAGRVVLEEAFSIRYMLRSLGVPRITQSILLLGDSLGSLISGLTPGSSFKKNINFHYEQECFAAKIIQLVKVDTKLNLAMLS